MKAETATPLHPQQLERHSNDMQVLGDQPLRLVAGRAVRRAAGGQAPAPRPRRQASSSPVSPPGCPAVRGPDRCHVPVECASGALSPVRVVLLIDPRSPCHCRGRPQPALQRRLPSLASPDGLPSRLMGSRRGLAAQDRVGSEALKQPAELSLVGVQGALEMLLWVPQVPVTATPRVAGSVGEAWGCLGP